MPTYEFSRPAATVDVVLFSMRDEDLAVLLIRRKDAPFKGHWALPGGFINENEKLEKAAERELSEETGIANVALEQLGAFGDPGRDPRGHTISVAYYSFVVAESHPVRAGDDAAEVAWIPLRELAIESGGGKNGKKLAFDHAAITARARERLQSKLNDPSRHSSFDLVPPRFTLTELQKVYEAVLGRTLDKRNFRARIIAHGLVEPVASAQRTGRHRPAQLYRWRQARRTRG